jgi:Dit-like phage tail protein
MSVLSFVAAFNGSRSIGAVVSDVTIEETHRDDIVVTEHPVENTAPISDHAYQKPQEVTIRGGWSPSSLAAGGDPHHAVNMYRALWLVQNSLQPVTIVTGKRIYQNMMVISLSVTTNDKQENSVMFTAVCRTVILVQTQATGVTPAAVQANPSVTSQKINTGTQAVKPAPNFNPNTAG